MNYVNLERTHCYQHYSVVCRAVSLSHYSEPCRNGWTDRDAVWFVPLWSRVSSRNYVLYGGPDIPREWAFFVKYRVALPWATQKRLNRWKSRFGCGLGWSQRTIYLMGFTVQITQGKGQFWGEGGAAHGIKYSDTLHWAVQKGRTDRDAVWYLDSGRPKERWGCTMAKPGEYQWTVHVRRRCSLLSNTLTNLKDCIRS